MMATSDTSPSSGAERQPTPDGRNRTLIWVITALALLTLTAYVVTIIEPFVSKRVPDDIRHLLLTIAVVLSVHVLDRLFLHQETRHYLETLEQNVAKRIDDHAKELTSKSTSLEAMRETGVLRMFSDRASAAQNIRHDLCDDGTEIIRLIGISLNDFVRPDQSAELRTAWTRIADYVHGRQPRATRIDIQILIIDPLCLGAQLRLHGEERKVTSTSGRLDSDVKLTVDTLRGMQQAAANQPNVNFQCRLYRLPPNVFLSLTKDAAYEQPYHFWADRETQLPLLLFKPGCKTYDGLRDHFDWVWEWSVPLPSGEEAAVGTDRGIYQCGIQNIYTDKSEGLKRILYSLRNSKGPLRLQGVSLNSFFNSGLPLYDALDRYLRNGNSISALFLDPFSDQARFRSARESNYLGSMDDYSETQLTESRLFRDTVASVRSASELMREHGEKINIRFYSSSPGCFLLLVDSTGFVEQYHYGRPQMEGAKALLGKEMPLFEYARPKSFKDADGNDAYLFADNRREEEEKRRVDLQRLPVHLLEDHWIFAWKTAQSLSEWVHDHHEMRDAIGGLHL